MVLMDDYPLVINLAQADCQTEIQLDILSAGFPSGALQRSGDKGHITTSSDTHFLYIKNYRLMSPRKE